MEVFYILLRNGMFLLCWAQILASRSQSLFINHYVTCLVPTEAWILHSQATEDLVSPASSHRCTTFTPRSLTPLAHLKEFSFVLFFTWSFEPHLYLETSLGNHSLYCFPFSLISGSIVQIRTWLGSVLQRWRTVSHLDLWSKLPLEESGWSTSESVHLGLKKKKAFTDFPFPFYFCFISRE